MPRAHESERGNLDGQRGDSGQEGAVVKKVDTQGVEGNGMGSVCALKGEELME